jgi:predicted AlkP superfamily pyrophosphatase or phosphodiesterase
MLIGILLPGFLCATALAAQSGAARHVVVVGVDGLGSHYFDGAAAPVMRRLMKEGAWTLKARAVFPTVSAPNWASIIMGAGPEQHGVTSNEWHPRKFDVPPVCAVNGRFPSVFGELRRQRPAARIAVIHDWDDFARLVEPGVADVLRHVKGSRAAAEAAIAEWRERAPTLLFLHLDAVDHAGHGKGWGSAAYHKAVEEADGLIGRLARAMEESAAERPALLIVTSDHGGTGTKHGNMTMPDIEVPWIAWGAGVRAGEITAPVDVYDTAPAVAAALGIQPHACWIGRPRGLK